ncbi:hypothetical protein G9A89_013556 [Geosiphon pyriformis]|nr:hypothetical protein G9A89_013556 [Geosiphon pyriformis]
MELEKRTQSPNEVSRLWKKLDRRAKNLFHYKRIENRSVICFLVSPGLKKNLTMDMAIELAQRIEDNQRMYLESILPVFAFASVMAPVSQMTATSFAAQTQDPNKQLIDRLTTNLAWLLEPLQPQKPKFEPHFNQPQQFFYQRQQNHGPSVCYHCELTGHFSRDCNNFPLPPPDESTSQLEENLFYAFNLTDNDYDMNELAINTSDLTKKKKKANVDFILDLNKASTSTADNNEPPKTKVFKNSSKLELPKIVQKSGPYFVVKDLIETPAHITIGHNVTPLICKAQIAGYFIDLILDSELSVSIIAKHFLKAIGRKIDKPSTRPINNVYGDKKKDLDIAKAVPVHINSISIKTDIEVFKAKECGEKPIVIKCYHWTTSPVSKQNQEKERSDELDDDKSNKEED